MTQSQTDPLPATYTASGSTRVGTLDASVFQNAVIGSLYDHRAWPNLAEALRAAAQDGTGAALLQLSDTWIGRSPDGSWKPRLEPNAVIGCLDRPGDDDRRTDTQERADVARFAAELPPFGGSWALRGCIGMPRAPGNDTIGDVHVVGAPASLIVATTGDPATPYAEAAAFSARLPGSTILTFDSTDHTAFGTARSTCIDGLVTTYLLTLSVPPAGTNSRGLSASGCAGSARSAELVCGSIVTIPRSGDAHRQSDILRHMEPQDLIAAVRRRRGLTQAELAARAGTSQPVVSAYEHGRRDPTFGTLRRLIAAGGEQLVIDAVAHTEGPPPAIDDIEHARRLVDVLLFADAVPARARPVVLLAPRLVSL